MTVQTANGFAIARKKGGRIHSRLKDLARILLFKGMEHDV
jgi:hypothetical protein